MYFPFGVTTLLYQLKIPDKAHGTALTYGLKYYFRNKFCMRQLGSLQEDPDGMEYGREEKETGTKGNPSRNRNEKAAKPVSDSPEQKSGKDLKQAAGSGENRIFGNAIPNPKGNLAVEEVGKTRKPEPDVRKKEEGKDSEESGLGRKEPVQEAKGESPSLGNRAPEPKETQAEDGKSGNQQIKTGNKQAETAERQEELGDGFRSADKEEVPFEDGSFLDELEQEMEEQTEHADSDLEAAKNYVCTFGLYDGKTLGEMMNSGLKCREAVKWIANRYKGTDQGMVAAAKLLLENQDLVVEQQAA